MIRVFVRTKSLCVDSCKRDRARERVRESELSLQPMASSRNAAVPEEATELEVGAHKPQFRITAYVVFTCIMAGTGGLMYGYDLAIPGGISVMDDFLLKFYPSVYMHKKSAKEDNYCKYNNHVFQLFSSAFYLAALAATFLASLVSQKHGRKATIFCAGVLFTVGTAVGAAAQNLPMLMIGRILLGCGIGFSNQAVPVFLSEIAPPSNRGGLNTLFGVFIAVGVLFGNLVNYGASKHHPWGWRLSLGLAGIPALLLLLCSFVVVETPSSLIERGKLEEAKEVLRKLRGNKDVTIEFEELLEACESHHGQNSWASYKDLFCERNHIAEVVLASLYSAVVIGVAGLSGALLVVFLVDKVGRRRLLLYGCLLMASSLVVVGSIFGANLRGNARKLPPSESIAEVVMVCAFVAAFSVSLGPLAWLIPSEILSQSVRSAGQSVVVFVNMFLKFVIAQTFLSMLCAFKFGIFFFFAGCVLVTGIFFLLFLPETKRIPLHKMEALWQEHWFWKHVVPAASSAKPSQGVS